MSEADTPKSNPAQPAADLFPPESSTEPASPTPQEPEPQSAFEGETPSLEPDQNESEFTVIEGASHEDPVTVDFAQESDWFVQARKQRQRNRELVKTVAQLEQALAETQEELKAHGIRAKSAETIITQQAEELYSSKQQLSQFFQDLEATHQTTQRQQLLIDTLSEQLETAQQQVTVLEEECNALRELEQQQAQKLQQAQFYAEELAARLQYQQHQAQQFKAALDKCLESPQLRQQVDPDQLPEPAEILPDPLNLNQEGTPPPPSELSPLSLASPRPDPAAWGRRVQPWSMQFRQELEDGDLSPVSELPAIESLPLSSEAFAEISPEPLTSEVESPEVEASTTPDSERDEEISAETETEIETEIATDEPAVTSEEEKTPEQIPLDPPVSSEEVAESTFSKNQPPRKKVNWPSPTLSPVRPPKKRKSLAAVDLPSFPRFS